MRPELVIQKPQDSKIELVIITDVSAMGEVEGKLLADNTNEIPSSHNKVIFNDNPSISVGDKVLAQVVLSHDTETNLPIYNAKLIRRTSVAPQKIIGVFKKYQSGDILTPINKKDRKNYFVSKNEINASDGELVEAKIDGTKRKSREQTVELIRNLGNSTKTKLTSLIAILEHGIPNEFSDDVLQKAELRAEIPINNPSDLTDLPFISIDPSDARDHDDAIYAIKDEENPDGFIVWVAIADVAKYVISESSLDLEALNRGNSTYFPDLVVPMIPDILSGNVCSLKQDVMRASIAVKIIINDQGQKVSHNFFRGVIKNRLAVSYETAQNAIDSFGKKEETSELKTLMHPLYQAYKLLENQSQKRKPLELELVEQKISLDTDGEVTSINSKERFDSHKLVEEFMILANVCAAETIQKSKLSSLYRVHEPPTFEKLLSLKTIAKSLNVNLNSTAKIRGGDLNNLLRKAKEQNCGELVSMTVLRAMSQAHYTSQNEGHFGLSLPCYSHFTSPIRRYSDILVHRAIIQIHKWENNPIVPETNLVKMGEHLSRTERRSMLAERETKDRYLATFLKNKIGGEFDARINGLSKSGMFVRLNDTGADGLIPISSLYGDRYSLNTEKNRMVGRTSKTSFNIGANVLVRLREANPVSGGLIFSLIEYENKPIKTPNNSTRRFKTKRRIKRRRPII